MSKEKRASPQEEALADARAALARLGRALRRYSALSEAFPRDRRIVVVMVELRLVQWILTTLLEVMVDITAEG